VIQEYAYTYGLKALINRCGVIRRARTFGKVDQGVFTLLGGAPSFWRTAAVTGFGGEGNQVRESLDPAISSADRATMGKKPRRGRRRFTMSGAVSVTPFPLRELTELCLEATGRTNAIGSSQVTHPFERAAYTSADKHSVEREFGWRPGARIETIRSVDIAQWLLRTTT